MNNTGDIPGGPEVKTLRSSKGARVRELRLRMQLSTTKKIFFNFKKKKMNNLNLIGDCEAIHINYLAKHLIQSL